LARRSHQIYTVKDLLALKDDPDRWIVENMIPRAGRTLVFGQGGTYKSTIIFDLCVALSAERMLLRQFTVNKFGPVLLNSTEGSIFDNKDRLLAHARAHAVNPAELPLYFCQQPFCLDDALDTEELEQVIKTIEPIVVVLDPLDSFFSGDENSSKETKALRRAVDRMVDEYQTSFIIIHHETKGKDPTPRGSSAWYGWADAVLHVKTWKKKLGLPSGETEIVTVESLKQRNGKKGHVFSAVPRNDDELKQVTFAFYNDKDHSGVVLEYWKHACYKVLRDATVPMTNQDVAATLGVRPEKILQALMALEEEGLADKNAELPKPFGPDGSRTRMVPAWQALKKISLVDLAEYMVKEEEAILEEELQEHVVVPELPEPNADTSDSSRVRPVGGTSGPILPQVLH
jgi:hypothetical protein